MSFRILKVAISLLLLVILAGCSNTSQYVDVKYSDGDVDIADPSFEELNTSKSSFIEGAWYDAENEYMIINLSGTNYNYCDLPKSVWSAFKSAESYGSTYNDVIKGRYACS